MRRLVLAVLLSASVIHSQNVSPQFSALEGMEDQSGNTHLFYRVYTSSYDSVTYWVTSSDNIYHFDLLTQEDTLFLESYYDIDSIYFIPDEYVISELTFWENSPNYYIYGGATEITILNEHTFIQRFNSENTYNKRGVVNVIEISKQNDSLLYAGVAVYDTTGLELTIKSTDGGWNWVKVPGIYQIVSLSPVNDNIFLARDEISKKLFRTTDSGSSFNLVDSSMTYWEQQYHYDQDESHIYRVVRNFFTRDYELKVSSNSGEAFSWATEYSSPNQIFISNNALLSGEIYLADGKNIFLSTNYGNNFNLYKKLERNIVGIYKKSSTGGTNKLYAATRYRIYEITPDTLQIIKTLPIPDEMLAYYPLAIGNKWIYDYIIRPDDITQEGDSGIHVREVISDTVAANGKRYYKIIDETLSYFGSVVLERVDTLTGKVFRYFEDPSLQNDEFLIHDLLAEVGDTIHSSRYFYDDFIVTTVLEDDIFNKWGIVKPKKVYQEYTLGMFSYSLTKEFGLDSIYFIFDFGFGRTELKGAIINGVIYGDTTVVSVEDETLNFPEKFSLSQNYPNPFNPSTSIQYAISSKEFVNMKVYDVLGNEITTLINEEKPAGSYEINFDARGLTSGIYFYKLKAGSFLITKKMIFLK